MDRVERIRSNPFFLKHIKENEEKEVNREFCKHTLEHSLDVARILYILVLEQGLDISKDVLYAMALLHDIGRYTAEDKLSSHHIAGAYIAKGILESSGYNTLEIQNICDAIEAHHTLSSDDNPLKELLYRADKLSRNCFDCKAYEKCYWDENLKNKHIIY